MMDTRTEPESERVWRHVLVAKHTGLVDDGNTAIAHDGVYVARGGSHIRQTAFSQLTGARITFRVVRNSNSEVRNPRLPFQVVSSHPRSR